MYFLTTFSSSTFLVPIFSYLIFTYYFHVLSISAIFFCFLNQSSFFHTHILYLYLCCLIVFLTLRLFWGKFFSTPFSLLFYFFGGKEEGSALSWFSGEIFLLWYTHFLRSQYSHGVLPLCLDGTLACVSVI